MSTIVPTFSTVFSPPDKASTASFEKRGAFNYSVGQSCALFVAILGDFIVATDTFLNEAVNVVFLGPPGVGKTHLSIALGMEAVSHGISVYFTKAHDMLTDLKKAYQEGRIRRRMAMYLRPRLLICDEVGFLPLDRLEADLFFQVISARYERASTVVTSNKSFGDWGELMGDPVLATAILDRLLHHSHIINIRGESYRLKEKARAGVFSGPKV
ncbi:MAG: ATP-binding protein [Firmicutes bacterium]|nr:ATP-binding protein [Candidatus Fermentithermobacillaceae bacterium]